MGISLQLLLAEVKPFNLKPYKDTKTKQTKIHVIVQHNAQMMNEESDSEVYAYRILSCLPCHTGIILFGSRYLKVA